MSTRKQLKQLVEAGASDPLSRYTRFFRQRAAADAVQTLIAWAHQGPEAARVERVQVSPAAAEELATLAPGFVQRETL